MHIDINGFCTCRCIPFKFSNVTDATIDFGVCQDLELDESASNPSLFQTVFRMFCCNPDIKKKFNKQLEENGGLDCDDHESSNNYKLKNVKKKVQV